MKALYETLGIRKGITTFIGAGGKTSTIMQLAKELHGCGKTVIVTTTTKMYMPTKEQMYHVLLDPTEEAIEQAVANAGIIAIGGGEKEGKLQSISEALVGSLVQYADYVLVEGDGSKCRPLKVPLAYEPVIPEDTQQVVIVVGLTCIGLPLNIGCCRYEKAMTLLGITDEAHKITIDDVITFLINPEGLQQGIEGREQVLLINQADCIEEERLKEIKNKIRESYTHPVCYASLREQRWV